MDNSVLTEQRREMVINLLKGMKIRRSDGEGFDKDDVYACMQQLCDVYEKSIEDLTAGYETELGELQEKYQKYDENNDLYISLIMEAKKSSNEIISKAQSEVDEILANGKAQIEEQENEIARVREAAQQEQAALAAEIERAKAEAAAEKKALEEDLDSERSRVETVRAGYISQIDTMDQEFEEIKTNILRTAGKLDGLRTQLQQDAPAAEWKVQEELTPIDVPEPDIAIEETPAEIEEPVIPAAVIAEAEAEAEAPAEEPAEEPAEADGSELTFEQLVAKLQKEDFAEKEASEAPTELAEPEVEIPAAEEVVEIAAEAPAEPAVEEPTVEEAPAETEAPVDETEQVLKDLEELSEETFEIELPEEPAAEEAPIEEISFEGLEELFKD